MAIPIIYIDTQQKLENAIVELATKTKLYLDLEFDKNHFRYGFQLCLIQIFDGTTCFLIDPLSDLSIPSIFPIFENESIALICFAADEDMRLLHHIGTKPNQIIDLSIAMKLLDMPSLSLSNALLEITGYSPKEEKKANQQMSNWFKRPISQEQTKYAANDVLYLPQLYHSLYKKLAECSRETWMEEEMNEFKNKDWENGSINNYLTSKDQKLFTLREWMRFENLMEYREKLSASLDRPSYKVWDKNKVIELAKSPQNITDWQKEKGKHPRIKTLPIQKKIETILLQTENEIKKNKITKNVSALPCISKEEKQRKRAIRKQQNEIKNQFFLPLKQAIQAKYGENLGNYILSNRKINELTNQRSHFLNYQKEIVLSLTYELNLTVPFTI